MKNLRNSKLAALLCYLFVLLAAVVSVGAALYMQHGKGLQPCTMCIIQRYAFILIGICALFALVLPFRPARILSSVVGIIGALGGAVAAVRNLWVMYHPEILCGRDPVELFLNGLPTAQWFPKVFMALGLCSDPIPPLFGLALPTWSLIGLIVLGGLLGLTIRRR
jgi:disulfide bond formation protein DsbB